MYEGIVRAACNMDHSILALLFFSFYLGGGVLVHHGLGFFLAYALLFIAKRGVFMFGKWAENVNSMIHVEIAFTFTT